MCSISLYTIQNLLALHCTRILSYNMHVYPYKFYLQMSQI